MPDYSYIFFNKTPLQLRSQGARGGRTFARNQRRRRALIALLPKAPEALSPRASRQQTTAEAIAALDGQFPWLRHAERSRLNNSRPGLARDDKRVS